MNSTMKTLAIVLGVVILILIGANVYVRMPDRGLCEDNPEACDDSNLEIATTTAGNPIPVPGATSTPVEKQYIQLYFIDIEGAQGASGEKIGCGDKVVPVKWRIEPTQGVLRAALEELIGLGVRDVKVSANTYYNALYQSELKVDSAAVENGVATVRLSGKLLSGGTCDDPRIVAQLKSTVEQFPTVKSSKIFINNQPLETYFSGR